MVGWGVGVMASAGLADSNRLVVASLNPILSDVAREIGGERVTVIAIMKPGANPHTFSPSPADLQAMHGARLVLASGKGLERYLDDVRGGLGTDQTLIEIGATLPSLYAVAEDDHDHAGGEDPHWWQSIDNMQRGVRVMADAFVAAYPAGTDEFRAGQADYAKRLEVLDLWVRQNVARIPPHARTLATAHAAFGYFCRDYGFTALPIQGLSTEQEPSPAHLREIVDTIRREHVIAIFPEVGSNPKILQNMVQETGVRIGERLLAGSPNPGRPTYEAMMRNNVQAIVTGLRPVEP